MTNRTKKRHVFTYMEWADGPYRRETHVDGRWTHVDRFYPWNGGRLPYDLDGARMVAHEKYAWPGGYPLVAFMRDGGRLCPACVVENWREIVDATEGGYRDPQWEVIGAEYLDGGPEDYGGSGPDAKDHSAYCAHCGRNMLEA